jgi:hypothetical protein
LAHGCAQAVTSLASGRRWKLACRSPVHAVSLQTERCCKDAAEERDKIRSARSRGTYAEHTDKHYLNEPIEVMLNR